MPSRRPRRRAPAVSVLRVGHRAGRDPRLTTHLALTARALGAERLHLHPPDPQIADRLARVAERWGGRFSVVGAADWKAVVRSFDGPVVHLTMYGVPVEHVAPTLRRSPRLLVVVGGAKVPSELFALATHNVAVGAQPHSEVGALAVLLDRVGSPVPPDAFDGAHQVIVPSRRGKRVREVRRGARA